MRTDMILDYVTKISTAQQTVPIDWFENNFNAFLQ